MHEQIQSLSLREAIKSQNVHSLEEIETLDASGMNIQTLNGIEQLTNL